MKILLLKILNSKNFNLIINGVWAIPLVLLARAVRPYIVIGFGRIRSERVGHFVVDSSYFLVLPEVREKSKKYLDLFI